MTDILEIGLGAIDACDVNHGDYNSADCEKKTKRNDFWGGFLNTALTVLVGGTQKEATKDQQTNTQNNTQQKSALEIEVAMFNRLTTEEKKAYAKQNPDSPIVKEWQNTRFWNKMAIGGAVTVVVGTGGYFAMRAMYKQEPDNKKEKKEQD